MVTAVVTARVPTEPGALVFFGLGQPRSWLGCRRTLLVRSLLKGQCLARPPAGQQGQYGLCTCLACERAGKSKHRLEQLEA